jgi:hypothetical protein
VTNTGDAADPLAGLCARLTGGVLETARANRATGWRQHDHSALGTLALAEISRRRHQLGDEPAPSPADITALIEKLADSLAANRPLLLAVLYSPHLILDRLPGSTRTEERWAVLCWIAEAAWHCVSERPQATADRQLLTPLAARLRFLVLSEPMRHRAKPDDPWLANCDHDRPGLYAAVFGDDSWHELLGRCREARWNWQAHLDAHQSAPLLAQAKAAGLEAELGLLIFRTGRARHPLVLSREPLSMPARVGADDRAVIAEVAERHLLPRFQLGRVTALVTASSVRLPVVLTLLPLVAAIAALVLAGCGRFDAAARAALGCYALIGLGAVLGGSRVAAPWLLRVPAAAALGLLVLIALHPTWWNTPKGGWGTPAALLALSFGYLLVEVRNHGVETGAAILRASAVTCVAALHALLVALVGLVIVAPAYAERPDNGPRIADWFASDAAGRPWHLLALAAACCLAVGVFSQILWEDRPITASLAHVDWRSGR